MSANSISSSEFFVVYPQNNKWDVPCTKTVIQGKRSRDKWGIVTIDVLAPKSFAQKWPHVLDTIFVQCQGPARELNDREYVQLIHQIDSKFPLPVGWEKDGP